MNAVAWAPSGYALAYAADDDRAPVADKFAVRVLVPAAALPPSATATAPT